MEKKIEKEQKWTVGNKSDGGEKERRVVHEVCKQCLRESLHKPARSFSPASLETHCQKSLLTVHKTIFQF